MKKAFISISIFTLLVALGICAFAEVTDKDKGSISVNASTTKEIAPNQAEISISIETSDSSLKNASENNKVIANNVYTCIKAILDSNDYIKTGEYSARPQYIYTKDNKKILDKYVVTNTVTVKTKNLKVVPKLIDTAIEQGATKIDNLNFSAINYEDICNDALADLTKKAYIKAKTIASSINAKIVGIQTINTTCNTNNNPIPFYAYPMAAKGSFDGASSTPISSGQIKLFANIDASFYIK